MDKKVKMQTKVGNFFYADPEDVEKYISKGFRIVEEPKKKAKSNQASTSTKTEESTKKTSA